MSSEGGMGWPDPERPGFPLRPEQDGAHLLLTYGHKRVWALWEAKAARWVTARNVLYLFPRDMVTWGWRYLGPGEATWTIPARLAAERIAGREEAAEACERRVRVYTGADYDGLQDDLRADGARDCAALIRSLPSLSGSDALAAMLASAEARGRLRGIEEALAAARGVLRDADAMGSEDAANGAGDCCDAIRALADKEAGDAG